MKIIFFICVLLLIANSNRIFTLEARESLQGFLPGCIFSEKLIPFNVGQNPEDSVILLNNWFYYWKAPQLMLANTSLPPPNNTMPPSSNFEQHEDVPSFSKLHHEHHHQHRHQHFSGRFAKKIHMLKRNDNESNSTTNSPTPYPFPPPATHQAPTINPTPSPSSSHPSIQFFIPFDQGGAGLLGDLPDNTELEALQNRQALRIAKNFALTTTNIYPGATFYGIATLDLAGSVQFVVQVKNVSSWGEVHVEFAAFLIDANDVQDSTCSWAQRETNLTRSCPQNWQRLDDGCF